jgi:hypothetical protein
MKGSPNTPSSSKHNGKGILAGFISSMKVNSEIITPFPKVGPRKTGGRTYGKSRILTDTPEKSEIENQRAKKGKRKYSGKVLEKKMVKKSFITLDCSEEESEEIP